MMKKITFIFLAFLSLTIYGQDVTFNFNAGDENWEASGFADFAASGGNITTGVTSDPTVGGFAQLRSDAGLNLTYNDYKIIRFVIENSTNVTEWQVINYDTGTTNAGASEKENFDIPTVASGAGFTTFDVAIPANGDNAGIIDRIGIRARQGNPFAWTGEFKIAQVVIIDTTLEDSFVANPGFETSTDWTASGGEATGSFTAVDPQTGTQAGQLTFTTDQTSTQTLDNTINDFGVTVNPLEINATFWFKAPRTAIEVQILYDLYAADGVTKISSNNTGTFSVATPNTWEQVTLSKTITDEFNQIQFRLKIKQGALDGDVVSFDDVTANFSYFQTSNSWTGLNTDWANISNWTNGVVPVANKNADIQLSANNPIIGSTTGAAVNNLVVDPSASLAINSGGSLIVNGTSTGNITYNRNLLDSKWYLVSSPFSGESIDDIIANNSFLNGSIDTDHLSFAPYNNAATDVNQRFDYVTAVSTGSLGDGQGYLTRLSATNDMSFTGTMNVTDFTSINLSDNSGSSGNAFNLLGNPYPSYIDLNTLLTSNDSGGNDLLTEATVWIWNGTTYTERNLTTTGADAFIAPAQGFFVNADGASTSFTITEAMQSHQGTDSFEKNESLRPEILLIAKQGKNTSDANIYYIDGTSTGFDNGYDSSIFSGLAENSFEIYTAEVSNDTGKNLGIQSLPNADHETMVIPVGIRSEAGSEVTFTAESLNLPSGLKVFLEDKENDTFNELTETSNYKVTLTEKAEGTGRFYLHTKSSALSIDDNVALNNISIYKTNKSTLRIAGLQQGKASIKLFNVLGKQVMNSSFESAGVKDVSLSKLATGVYIVQLETENGNLNKKIVLE